MNGAAALLRLALADLRENWGRWAWTFFVAAVGAACIGAVLVVRATLLEWLPTQPLADQTSLQEIINMLTGQITLFVGVAAVIVITSSASLTVSTQAREYALWKVLGVQAWQVLGMLLTQLFVLGALAGAVGVALGPLFAKGYLQAWTDFPDKGDNVIPQLALVSSPSIVPAVLGITAAFTVLGGIAAAWKTARLPEMQALRDSEAPAVGVSWLTGTAAVLLTLLALAIAAAAFFIPDIEEAGLLGGFAAFFVIAAALTVSPLTLRPLLFAITAPIPRRATAAFLAREGCRYRSGQSMVTIVPFAVVLSLIGSIYGLVTGTGGTDPTGVETIFALVFVVAGAGGIANIALVGAERRRDLALLEAAGAGRSTLRVLPLLEGGMYALTGIAFGLLATVLTVAVVAPLSGENVGVALRALPWAALLGLGAGGLGLAVFAVWVSTLRWGRAKPVAERLRGQ